VLAFPFVKFIDKSFRRCRWVLRVAAVVAFVGVGVSLLCAQSGSLDITFNPGSGVSNGAVLCMALQTNGQIVLGGYFTSFNGFNSSDVARVNADGSVDTTFDFGAGPDGQVNAIAVQSDGKILIGGDFDSIHGVSWNQPARLRIDGSVDTNFDTSFADGAGATNGVTALALQPDGKVLMGGGFSNVGGINYNGVARLNTNGTLDATFNPGTAVTNGVVNALGLQSTGKVIVGGTFTAFNGVSLNSLARLNSNGSLDTAFNAAIQDGSVITLTVTPQDQIVIGGTFTSINGYSRDGIARLNSDGSVDATFDPGLGVSDGSVMGVSVQGDGKVVIGGSFDTVNNTYYNGVARLNTNGTLDVSFNPGTGVNGQLFCVASQPDGKTLIGGAFTSFNGTNINGIARLNGDSFSATNPQLLAANLYFGTWLYGSLSNTYRIEWTANLATPSLWTPLFDVTLQSNSMFIVDPNPPAGQRFYRAVQVAP
jgi:uncharacterized delta-60 repeat protein